MIASSCCISIRRPRVATKHGSGALSAAELQQFDQASRLPPEYPGWMFERQGEYRRKQLLEG